MNKQVKGELLDVSGLVLAVVWHVIVIAALAAPVAMDERIGTVEVSEVAAV